MHDLRDFFGYITIIKTAFGFLILWPIHNIYYRLGYLIVQMNIKGATDKLTKNNYH